MSTYGFDSYVKALEERISAIKQREPKLTLAKLAASCGMQPSYVTNVLKGRAHFNSDQLFRVAEQLRFEEEETEYLLLLLEYERTQTPSRKTLLKKRVSEIQVKRIRAERYTETPVVSELTAEQLESYYLDPFVQLIHMHLSSVGGETNEREIREKFWMTSEHVEKVLATLESVGYIKRQGLKIEFLQRGKHLPRESLIRRPHHALMRIKSLDHMQRLSPDQAYSFSATISTEPSVRAQIKEEFLKYLKRVEKLVRDHDSGPIVQMNFDFFPWDLE